MKTDIIFLIGMRGSGKSTVGRELARTMGYGFADTDVVLQESLGKSIAELVEAEGWESFRRHESEVLQRVAEPRTVVATGGGCVLLENNRLFMRDRGVVVYLDVPLDCLVERLRAVPRAASRPSLTGGDMFEELGQVFRQRASLYCELNHIRMDGTKKISEIAEQIQRQLACIP